MGLRRIRRCLFFILRFTAHLGRNGCCMQGGVSKWLQVRLQSGWRAPIRATTTWRMLFQSMQQVLGATCANRRGVQMPKREAQPYGRTMVRQEGTASRRLCILQAMQRTRRLRSGTTQGPARPSGVERQRVLLVLPSSSFQDLSCAWIWCSCTT